LGLPEDWDLAVVRCGTGLDTSRYISDPDWLARLHEEAQGAMEEAHRAHDLATLLGVGLRFCEAIGLGGEVGAESALGLAREAEEAGFAAATPLFGSSVFIAGPGWDLPMWLGSHGSIRDRFRDARPAEAPLRLLMRDPDAP